MDIRHFQTFKMTADLGSFTKAAQALQYSQATITSHIQQLEEGIGYPLFDRLGKRIVLTAGGIELYPYAAELLNTYAKIKQISEDGGAIRGELRVGASETMTVYKLGPILSQYKKRYPDVTLSLLNDNCIPLRERLHSGDLDISITMEPLVSDARLSVHVLFEEPVFFVGGTHLEGKRVDELRGECLIFSEKNCSLRRSFQSYLNEIGMNDSNYMEFTSMEAMKQCVVSGLGISLMPRLSVAGLLREGKMTVLDAPGTPLSFYAQICSHRNKWQSKAHKAFFDLLLEESGDSLV
ncbi:LysR family transcriptional regulator [Paenibacillus sp. GCM10027627]|uniref:LysR family transcriptional regulator n=1 Tax=unclassified Paenibacillus TaxID=185978 RepID=UPI003628EF8A